VRAVATAAGSRCRPPAPRRAVADAASAAGVPRQRRLEARAAAAASAAQPTRRGLGMAAATAAAPLASAWAGVVPLPRGAGDVWGRGGGVVKVDGLGGAQGEPSRDACHGRRLPACGDMNVQ